jgi:hypothetical protein
MSERAQQQGLERIVEIVREAVRQHADYRTGINAIADGVASYIAELRAGAPREPDGYMVEYRPDQYSQLFAKRSWAETFASGYTGSRIHSVYLGAPAASRDEALRKLVQQFVDEGIAYEVRPVIDGEAPSEREILGEPELMCAGCGTSDDTHEPDCWPARFRAALYAEPEEVGRLRAPGDGGSAEPHCPPGTSEHPYPERFHPDSDVGPEDDRCPNCGLFHVSGAPPAAPDEIDALLDGLDLTCGFCSRPEDRADMGIEWTFCPFCGKRLPNDPPGYRTR